MSIQPEQMNRQCRHCGETRPDDLNHFVETPAGNRGNTCLDCNRARVSRWRRDNKQRAVLLDKSKHLQKKFGISLDEYRALHEAQDGRCAICGDRETARRRGGDSPRDLAVDHCHITGKVRGLLCFMCNTSLGRIEGRVSAFADYLSQHGGAL